jgi:hypothetical protein
MESHSFVWLLVHSPAFAWWWARMLAMAFVWAGLAWLWWRGTCASWVAAREVWTGSSLWVSRSLALGSSLFLACFLLAAGLGMNAFVLFS